MSDKLYNDNWKPGDGVRAPGNRSFDKGNGKLTPAPKSKPNPYTAAKAKDKNLDSYIKTRNSNKKGTQAYVDAQNKINEAYGVSKRHKATEPMAKMESKGPAHMQPKSAAEVKAYADNPDNFRGKTQYEAMGNSGQNNKAVGKNDNITKLTGPIAKPGDIKDPGVTSKADITGGQKPVGTNNTPKFEFRRGNQGESKADYTAAYDAAHDKFKKANPNAYKPLPADGNADNSGSGGSSIVKGLGVAVNQMQKENAPKKTMRTSLDPGQGSGMAMIDNSMKSMSRMTGDMTGGGKGLFGGIKERRAAKKAETPDLAKTTLKQKDTPDVASNNPSGTSGSSGGNYLDELEGPGSKTFGI
jgi:hypothetical protein